MLTSYPIDIRYNFNKYKIGEDKMNMQVYGKLIKEDNYTPKQASQSFVMEEIKGWVEEYKRQGIENQHEKKFVVALAKLHNKISNDFNKNGDSMPIEIDEIKIDK